MLKISRMTDYGTMILGYLAGREHLCSASEVALGTRVALPTVQKLLKHLARGGLVHSARGADGGYSLARAPRDITAAEVLDTLEGPLALTECSTAVGHCEYETRCQVGGAWQKINHSIRVALEEVSLADLCRPPEEFPLANLQRTPGQFRPKAG